MSSRDWISRAVARIEADFQRSADTHLIPVSLPAFPGVDFYLKDESSHPTGSLKHRLARSLFLYALCNGHLEASTTVIEASSGSTAVSEAYFARLLGLRFIAVMPAATSPEKIAAIEFQGGRCHLVPDPTRIHAESLRLAAETGGYFMDQFTHAERATDWRSNNNIAESIFLQMQRERHPVPAWIVTSPGTGGTTATIGRYVRYRRHDTQVLCADPEHSVFFDYFTTRQADLVLARGSGIEGIGRPRVEPSFIPGVIDEMVKVPDIESLAGMHYLARVLGRRVGGSTGTNLIGALHLAQRMRARGETGAIVGILCDGGERYAHSYYDPAWLAREGFDLAPHLARIAACAEATGELPVRAASAR